MHSKMISIAKDFSPTPMGRYADQHPRSGEFFRDSMLLPALKEAGEVTVDLDGTLGYGSSFLEEAFGGLIRKGCRVEDLRKRLHIQSSFAVYKDRVWRYIDEAASRAAR